MDSELTVNQKKLNNGKKYTDFQLWFITALIIGCILLAYSFLLFDNNADSDTSTMTKLAAVVYFLAIMFIGLSLRIFDYKSLILLFVACVYMAINYIRFGIGLRNDIIAVCVLALFIIMRRISIPRVQTKYIILSVVLPFVFIVAVGRPDENGFIISSLFANMNINPNTMSQVLFVNIFAIAVLFGKKKFGFVHVLVFAIGYILAYWYASRTAMISLTVLLIGLLVSYSRVKSHTIYKLFIVALVCSFIVIFVYTYWLPTVIPEDYVIFGKKLFTGRQWIYSEVIDYIMTSPTTFLFGYGHTSFTAANGTLLNAHNYWLQLWLQYGLVFMLATLIVFIKTVKSAVYQYDNCTAKTFITYCICLVMFCMSEAPITGRTMSILFLMPLLVLKNFACQSKVTNSKITTVGTEKISSGKYC